MRRDQQERLDAALDYAARGWPVFPLARGTKAPMIRRAHEPRNPCRGECGKFGHGLYDATVDPLQVYAWWAVEYQGAGIAIATGHGFDALDFDTSKAYADFEQLCTELQIVLHCAKVRTPHGWHLYVAPTGNGNKDPIITDMDYRGKGGYVVAPPSKVAGKPYTVVGSMPTTLPGLSARLLERLWPVDRPTPALSGSVRIAAPAHEVADWRLRAWGLAALQRVEAELRGLTSGRNAALNRLGFKAWGLAPHARTEEEVERVLLRASEANGYIAAHGLHAAQRTIASARAGMDAPRWPQ